MSIEREEHSPHISARNLHCCFSPPTTRNTVSQSLSSIVRFESNCAHAVSSVDEVNDLSINQSLIRLIYAHDERMIVDIAQSSADNGEGGGQLHHGPRRVRPARHAVHVHVDQPLQQLVVVEHSVAQLVTTCSAVCNSSINRT